MFMCKHNYGKVEGNYQYCIKCGKAIAAPKIECSHSFKIEREIEHQHLISKGIYKRTYILRCTKCGDIKTIEVA